MKCRFTGVEECLVCKKEAGVEVEEKHIYVLMMGGVQVYRTGPITLEEARKEAEGRAVPDGTPVRLLRWVGEVSRGAAIPPPPIWKGKE